MEANSETTTTAGGSSVAVLKTGRGGYVAVKAGMTTVYDKDGNMIPVTVLDLVPNTITQVKPADLNGLLGVQVGVIEKKASRVTKAEAGHAKKSNSKGFRFYKEFRIPASPDVANLAAGQKLSAGFIQVGDYVDVTGVSKGKGFQGVMKRYNYAGGYKTHGASLVHRSLGSIGNRADPGKVFRGKKMAGHMGHRQVTLQNLEVVRLDEAKGILLVRGNLPGPKTGLLILHKARKRQARQGKEQVKLEKKGK